MTADDAVGVLDRIIAVLEAFDAEDRALRVLDIAQRTGLATSTVSRIVAGLVDGGYLEREGTRVRLGLRLFELGLVAVEPRRIRAAALPVLHELRQATGASVHLAMRDGDDALVLARLRGRGTSADSPRVGERRPLAATPWGRAIRDAVIVHQLVAAPVTAAPIATGGQTLFAVALAGVIDDAVLRDAAERIAVRVAPPPP